MRTEEGELASLMRRGEFLQHQPAAQPGQHPHGQEEVRLACDPALPVEGDAAAGHDHVDMGMMGHRRAPAV